MISRASGWRVASLLGRCALSWGAVSGCGGERWVVGEVFDAGTDAAPQSDAASSVRCPEDTGQGIPLDGAPPALSPSHLGNWSASLLGVEADAFPLGQLQLHLARGAAALRFEDGRPAPTLVDPAGGYLCTSSVQSCASEAGFVAGVSYTLVEPRSRGSILSFGVFLDEPWHEWCRQQTPVGHSPPGCEPRYDVEPAYDELRWGESCAVRREGEWVEIGCDRLATVERRVCACTAEGCRARARLQSVHLRLTTPDRLEGALWFTAERAQGLLFARD